MSNNTGGADAKLGVGGCIVLLVLAAIIIAILWFVGNLAWDCLVNIFGGGSGGGGSRLAEYCSHKFGGGPLYRECISEGWKPWYKPFW